MNTYTYPTTIELTQIDAVKLPMSIEGNPLFEIFPPKNYDEHVLSWEQKDPFVGLMNVRGMGGNAPSVAPIGASRYQAEPGVYGEHKKVEEFDITARRKYGTVNEPIDITDLTLENSEHLLDRQNMRQMKVGYDLLCYGVFSSTNALGAVVHTDSYIQRIYTAITAWTNHAASYPLQDFRNVKLFARGFSVDFGRMAKAYLNQQTFNDFIANTNQSDLAGRRTSGLGTVLSLELANALLLGEGLPQMIINEDFWLDDSPTNYGNYVMFIPNGIVIVIGVRARGARLGEWAMTRNANNPGAAPGPYVWNVQATEPPMTVKTHRGFNGGIKLYFPSAIVIMKVY